MIPTLALGALLILGQQQPSGKPPEGIVIRELGLGFRSMTHIPNIRIPADAPPGPPTVGRVDTWMPFRITLENFGPPAEGTLILRTSIPSLAGPDVVYRKRVSLPPRGRKRVSFPIQYRSTVPLELAFERDGGGTIPLGGASSVALPPPRTIAVTASLMLVATKSGGRFSHFLARTRSGRLSQERFVVPVSPSDLPENPIAYDGVDAVALDDLPVRSLSDGQFRALRQFVARGGTLVLSILRQMNGLERSGLRDVLPGVPAEARNLAEVRALHVATGTECALDRPRAMTLFEPRAGARAWDDSVPVVIHRPFERGCVVNCGFPLSAPFLERWPGASRFMGILLDFEKTGGIPLPGGYAASELRRPMAVALKESMVRSIPPFRVVLGLMVAYGAVIVLVPYALFRRLRRLEWSWALVFLFALGGSWAVYALGLDYQREDSAAYRVSVIEGGAEPGPHVRHNFWSLFTVRGNDLDLSFEDPSTVPFPLAGDPTLRGVRTGTKMTVSYDGARIRGLRTYTQDSTLFETTDTQNLPARIRCEVRSDAPDLSIIVRPDPGFPFDTGWIVRGADIGEVGPQTDGESVVNVPNTSIRQVTEKLRAGGDPFFERAALTLLAYASRRSAETGRPLLLYAYEGAPSLLNSDLPERGADFGILDLSGASPPWGFEATWLLRELSASGPDGAGDPLPHSPEGVEVSMVLANLPPDFRPRDLRFSGTESFVLQIYDRLGDTWKPIPGHPWITAPDRYVYRSPLGPAYARLLVRNRVENTWTSQSPLNRIHVVSSLERSDP